MIGILIDDADRFEFFRKVLKNSEFTNSYITFFHSKAYTYFRYRKSDPNFGQHVFLAASNSSSLVSDCIESHIYKKIFYISKPTDAVVAALGRLDCLWVYSGFQLAAANILPYVKSIQYFEIGNFPNKFQSSSEGINADRCIKLASNDVSDAEVVALRKLLLYFVPPHVNKRMLPRLNETVVNFVFSFLQKGLYPKVTFFDLAKRAISLKLCRRLLSRVGSESIPDEYILFIGQVENDTQTVYQSAETQMSAVKKAQRIAKLRGLPLVVRMHPGEKDYSALRNTLNYCLATGIIVFNKSSLLEVVQGASAVVTVNSTGGLHSLLLDKEVILLGDTFYNGWCAADVVAYQRDVLYEYGDL